jgi:hypothetical protein
LALDGFGDAGMKRTARLRGGVILLLAPKMHFEFADSLFDFFDRPGSES